MATNKKPTNGGVKTSSPKPVAKTTVKKVVPPTAPEKAQTGDASSSSSLPPKTTSTIAYEKTDKEWSFKKTATVLGILLTAVVVLTTMFLFGRISVGQKSEKDQSKPSTTLSVETANPNKDFFEGPLVLKANEWSKTVFIRENIVWYPPLGVPYTIRINENQEIACDGVENPSLPDGVVSIQFRYRIDTNIIVKQVPFKKKT